MKPRVIILAADDGAALAATLADLARSTAPEAAVEINPPELPDPWALAVAVFAVVSPALAKAPFLDSIARLHHADHPICPIVADVATHDFGGMPPSLAPLAARNALGIGDESAIAGLIRFRLGHVADRDQQIFLSYRRVDATAECDAVRDALSAAGYRVFVDRWRLLGGDPVQREIEQAVRDSGLVLLFETADVTTSGWVRDEMLMAQRWRVPIARLRIGAAPRGFPFVQAPALDWPGQVGPEVRAFVNNRLARRRLFREAVARVLRDFAGLAEAEILDTRDSGRAGWLLNHPDRQVLVHADPTWPTLEGWHRLWRSHGVEFRGGAGDALLVTEAPALHSAIVEAARWAAGETPMALTTRVGLLAELMDLWTRPEEPAT